MDDGFPGRTSLAVELAGAPLAGGLASTLSFGVVRQALGAPAAAELDFADPDSGLSGSLRLGADLALRVGGETLFAGRVASVTHQYDGANGLVVRLRAYDPLHTARRRFPVRSFENVSAADLAEQLAGQLGVEFVSGESPPTRKLVLQHGESDLELLACLAAEAGLYPSIRGTELRLVALDGYGEELPLQLGRNLLSVTLQSSDEAALRRVETYGWDAGTLATFKEAANTARQDAFELHDVALDSAADGYERLLLDRLVEGAPEAVALAQAALDRAAASEAVASGTCAGQPDLTPGRAIRVSGVSDAFCGRYVVTSALHRFTAAEGYTTAFGTDPPVLRQRDRRAIITHGTVSDPDDPEGLGRCRVSLDSLGGLETGWLQTVVPGAGKGRGLVAFAEQGDAVLVVLPDGDPARGFVLGGLYGEQLLPRGVGVRTARPFVLRTAGGQSLEMGRDAALARLSTAAGSLVELTPEQMRLAAASDMVIEAPGRTITIRANAVNFEQG